MRILIVKLSSLGDVVHTLPALQDIRRAFPAARIDWVVEASFLPLLQRCSGIDRLIACNLRSWKRALFSAATLAEARHFVEQLQQRSYDAVIDLQGLTKSACVARIARTTATGQRYAMANRTEGSSYELPTRWVSDVAIPIQSRVHAVDRGRLLCAAALGYELTSDHFYGLKGDGLAVAQLSDQLGLNEPTVLFAHGSSRRDKCWPEEYWIELGRRFNEAGWRIALPHGSPAEHASSQRISDLLSRACVWPRLPLAELTDAMAACAGVVGVDSGLSHMAVALDLPHVQIYNLDTAWRTGPIDCRRQRSLYHHPYPDVDQVWRAWHEVSSA